MSEDRPLQESDRALQQEVLDFWFGARGSAEYGRTREVWFRKDAAFDRAVRERFGASVERAIAGGYASWTSPRAALARVILLDQFTRNIFRDTPRAFAGDALALAAAEEVVDGGGDSELLPVERRFLYLPFEHAESLEAQTRSIELFTRLRDETGLDEPLSWAHRHAAVIRRFGRYPHRNAILGRTSTADELAFLEQGNRF